MSNLAQRLLNNCPNCWHPTLPQTCLLCAAASGRRPLCTDCDAGLPRLAARRCKVCALPIPDGDLCGGCLHNQPRYDRVTAVFSYDFPIDALIHAFKYNGNLAIATVLGEALGNATRERPDVIIPMPISSQRLRERGFNQALEIARVVGKLTGIPVGRNTCRKVVDTQPQAALPWKQRAGNVRDAFVCDADLHGKAVAVVDDVLTTGSTLGEIAKNLRRAGAIHISGWVVARTLPGA